MGQFNLSSICSLKFIKCISYNYCNLKQVELCLDNLVGIERGFGGCVCLFDSNTDIITLQEESPYYSIYITANIYMEEQIKFTLC